MLHLQDHPLAVAILLLLAVSLAGAEIVDPDADDNTANFQDNGGTACNAADCTVHITDANTATAICASDGAASTTIVLSMASPSANPSTTANAQTVQGSVSRHDDANNGTSCAHDSGGNNPAFSVEIYCNGTASGVLPVGSTSITGDNQSFSGTFTFGTTIGTATCAADGSDLQFAFISTRASGGPSARRWAALEELEWDATVVSASRRYF